MAALRLPIRGTDHMVFLPAAGLPWFVAPFGRDSLIVSLQNILIYPEFARGALEIRGSLQAKGDDPYRDAEPGKILHELRCGELAHFKLIAHPYYGTADATPLYLITLHAAWRATGDKGLLERHLPTAEGLDQNRKLKIEKNRIESLSDDRSMRRLLQLNGIFAPTEFHRGEKSSVPGRPSLGRQQIPPTRH
jgi:glycogen debranching enzyme